MACLLASFLLVRTDVSGGLCRVPAHL